MHETHLGTAAFVRRRWPSMQGYLLVGSLLAPFAVVYALGYVYPLTSALKTSFDGETFGAEYQQIGELPAFWFVLRHTFVIAGTTALICLVVAYFVAEFIASASPRWQPVLLALVIVPLWSSAVARTYGWIGFFEGNGLVDRAAQALGLGPPSLLFTRTAVIVGMVHVMLPFMILPAFAAIQRYDKRLSQASLSLGAGDLRTFYRVKLPMLAPQLCAAGAAVFIISLGFYITPAILGGARSTMVSNLIAQQVFDRFDLPAAYAMSGVLLACVLASLLLFGGLAQIGRRRVR